MEISDESHLWAKYDSWYMHIVFECKSNHPVSESCSLTTMPWWQTTSYDINRETVVEMQWRNTPLTRLVSSQRYIWQNQTVFRPPTFMMLLYKSSFPAHRYRPSRVAWVVNTVAQSTFRARKKIRPTPDSHSWKWAVTTGLPVNVLRNWKKINNDTWTDIKLQSQREPVYLHRY